eukprot:gene445-227_t
MVALSPQELSGLPVGKELREPIHSSGIVSCHLPEEQPLAFRKREVKRGYILLMVFQVYFNVNNLWHILCKLLSTWTTARRVSVSDPRLIYCFLFISYFFCFFPHPTNTSMIFLLDIKDSGTYCTALQREGVATTTEREKAKQTRRNTSTGLQCSQQPLTAKVEGPVRTTLFTPIEPTLSLSSPSHLFDSLLFF